MRSPGALIASIGTSVMLVAAVTISLLSVSAVFALGGFEGSRDASSADELVLDLQSRSGPGSESRSESGGSVKPVAVAVVKRSPAPSTRAARRSGRHRDTVRARAASTARATPATSRVSALGEGTSNPAPEVQQPAASTANKKPAPNLDDGVRELGDGVSSAVQQTGSQLAAATKPLKPVSAVVQQVLNLVAGLVKGTTDALGGVLGARP